MICTKCNSSGHYVPTMIGSDYYYCRSCKVEIELEPVKVEFSKTPSQGSYELVYKVTFVNTDDSPKGKLNTNFKPVDIKIPDAYGKDGDVDLTAIIYGHVLTPNECWIKPEIGKSKLLLDGQEMPVIDGEEMTDEELGRLCQ